MQLCSVIDPVLTHTSGENDRKSDSCTDHADYDEGNNDQTTFPAVAKPILYANLFIFDQFDPVIRNWIFKITHLSPKVNATP